MKNTFIVISTILTLGAAIPYILDVLKKKTKPRIISWLNWSLLGAIAATASLSDHQYAAAIMSYSAAFECLLIVILGWRNGDHHLERVDYFSQAGVIISLILWWIFNSPAVAIISVILIDLIAGIPTVKHAWQKPYEETWILFLMSGLGAVFTILAAKEARITSLANPIYIALINFTFAYIILMRRRHEAGHSSRYV